MNKKSKCYLAGPMTGIPQFNFPAFDKTKKALDRGSFVEVFSPANHDRELLGKPKDWLPTEEDMMGDWKCWNIPNAPDLRTMLGDDLSWIAKNATHIFMMGGWENSKGARAEHALAVALGLTIWYE